jgi:hypothetical protein
MKIGVVCEGPTDYPAIVHFLKHALGQKNIAAQFRALHPEMDKTRPDGGWGTVLLWLKNNPAASRVQKYFGGGLFQGPLNVDPLDAIVIHLDADVLPDMSFINYVKTNYDYATPIVDTPADKAQQIIAIIQLAAGFGEMTDVDKVRHVPTPAVESTEAWCVAAFTGAPGNFETLTGPDLTNAFMDALERSEGRQPQPPYANLDKNLARRKRFCDTHANGSKRIVDNCLQFSAALDRLVALN